MSRRTIKRQRPFCIQVDARRKVVDSWGDAATFGLDAIPAGTDIAAIIPVLRDYSVDDELELPFITDDRNYTYHIHIFSSDNAHYVLLIDAREELAERRKYQQAMNEIRLALEKEQKYIAELVDVQSELTLRRTEAEQESRRRGEYIATMSHELRTPLTAIVAHAEKLSDQPLGEEVREVAQAIAGVAHRQLWVIDNLLSRAKLDAEGVAVYAGVTDLRRLIDELSLVFAPLAAEKAISYSAFVALDVPEFAWLDAFHLRQVLVNVLGNAIKYTREGSVELRMDYRDGRLLVIVTDTGPGIDAETLGNIFAPYVRGREASRAPGSGLGLGISRQLVESMGGELKLESSVGKGTTASFSIEAEKVSGDQDTSAGAAPAQILICDDDPDITDLLDVRLSDAGFGVSVAADAQALIAQAIESQPQVVIIDLNMPGLDGATAARRMREAGFRAPIVVLSGAAGARDLENALAAGCTQFVRKPPQMTALIRLIKELLLAERTIQK
jgi:signal transduction histidine kinase/CheY-like chemotaxis protein